MDSDDLHAELKKLSKSDGLALDIDIRTRALWEEISQVKEWDLDTIAAFVRAAYGQGYIDALNEAKVNDAARLCKDHGYRIP